MKYFTILFSLLLISACTNDQRGSNQNAFSITQCIKEDKGGSGFAKMKITVKNESAMVMGCYAYIKIKQGNTIIENKTLVYSSLNSGESQVEEAWFSKFNSHSEYDQAVVTLNWTIDSTGYSRDYVY